MACRMHQDALEVLLNAQRTLGSSACFLFAIVAFAGCSAAEDETLGGNDSDVAAASTSLFKQGFTVMTTDRCAEDPTADGCAISVIDAAGRAVSEDGEILTASWALGRSGLLRPLDSETIGACAGGTRDCYTIFRWPKTIPGKDHDAVGQQMREYSKLVGTVLHREPDGPGEQSWLEYKRSAQYDAVVSAAPGGPTALCEQVVKSFVDDLVPEGSEHRQYGNCGEGGHIGACLALKAGFAASEIRVCASENDHFFAMVKHPSKKWCLLDRWKLVNDDNFVCGVDYDATARQVTHEGTAIAEDWFQKVNCTSFASYVADPGSL
jgi:hypothetical protein